MAETDHGGDMDRALALYGGSFDDWIDLSTGINRMPWPRPVISDRAWDVLPTRADMAALCAAARSCYGTTAPVTALAGAQAAIQLLPGLWSGPSQVMKILSPSYNEYARVFRRAGWRVEEPQSLDGLKGADIAIVVNPNNPDGRLFSPEALLDLRASVGLLVVDESFIDPTPQASLCPRAGTEADGLLILRSFGKFFGLAGARLGFALGDQRLCAALAEAAGPWPVAGPALELGRAALTDQAWIGETRRELTACSAELARIAPWPVVGATALFTLFRTPDAGAARHALAEQHIWSRAFPWSQDLLRLGTPRRNELPRLAEAFARLR